MESPRRSLRGEFLTALAAISMLGLAVVFAVVLTADSVPTEEMTFVCAAMEWNCTDYDAAGRSQGEIHAQCGSLSGK